MKNITLTILLLALPLGLEAGEKVERTLEVPASADIIIEDPHGNLEIHAWDRNEVKVTGELAEHAKSYTFEKRGNKVVFEVDYDRKKNWTKMFRDSDSSELKFYVPVKSRLDVSNINDAIKITGVEGGTRAESVNGRISVAKLGQRISLQTVNGSINSTGLEGSIDIETVNGSVDDKGSSGRMSISSVQGSISSNTRCNEIEIEIVNGNLDLDLENVDELNIDSVNGSVEASISLNSKGEVRVSNVNGSVELLFDRDVSASFQVDSAVGGSIRNGLSDDKPKKQKYGPGKDLQFSHKGGSARVEVSTVSGRVKIGPR